MGTNTGLHHGRCPIVPCFCIITINFYTIRLSFSLQQQHHREHSWIWLSEVPAAAPAPADGNDGGGGAAGGGDGCCCFYSTELCRNGLFR